MFLDLVQVLKLVSLLNAKSTQAMPITPCNQSRLDPSIVVQYALIGVYNRLLYAFVFPCLLLSTLFIISSIVCIVLVVLSCSLLIADFFTLIKIDDQYPDEWNDQKLTFAVIPGIVRVSES